MRERTFFQKILFYATVPKCVCCSEKLDITDFGLCKACLKEYYNIKSFKCSVCMRPYYECSCSNDYLKSHYIHQHFKLFKYKHYVINSKKLPTDQLIYNLKSADRRDVIDFIADELFSTLNGRIKNIEEYCITNVPRSKKRYIKYGFDHSEKIAKALAKRLKIEYVSVLKSLSQNMQKQMSGTDRIKNAMFDYKNNIKDLTGKNVLLVDDIVTTGASMGACAMLLRGLGAKKIIGVSIAISRRDKYIPFKYVRPIK